MVWNSLLPHWVTSLECCYFITQLHKCAMGAKPMAANNCLMLLTYLNLDAANMGT